MRTILLAAATAALLGCGPSPSKKTTASSSETAATAPSPLEQLRRDYAPLAAAAPSWLIESTPRSPEVNMAQLRGLMQGLDGDTSPSPAFIAQATQLVFLMTDLERGLADGSCDLECLTLQSSIYRMLEGWSVLLEMEFFQDFFGSALAMMQLEAREKELFAFVRYAVTKADDNWKHFALRQLEHPDTSKGDAVDILLSLANDASWEGDYELASGLYRVAVERNDGAAPPKLALAMASNCYRSLDRACGDEHLKKVGEVSDDLKERLEEIREESRDAAVVAEAPAAPTVEQGIRVAKSLLRLGRIEESRTTLKELQKGALRDARVVAGLAEIHIEDKMSFGSARKLLLDARDFDHKDETYYELLVGTSLEVFKSLMGQAGQGDDAIFKTLDAAVRELEANLKQYATFNADKGQTLLFAIRIGKVMLRLQEGQATPVELRKTIDELIPAVDATVSKGASPYLRRLQLVLARFDANAARGLKVVQGAEVLEETASLHRNIKTSLVLAAGSGAAELARDLESAKDDASQDQRAALIASSAIGSGKAEEWKLVGEIYSELAGRAPDAEHRARYLNNLAVALFHLGQVDEARELLTRVQGPEPTLAALNGETLGGSPNLARLEALSEADISAMGKVQAKLWLHRIRTNRPATAKERQELVDQQGSPAYGPRVTGEHGVILDNSFSIGFGFSVSDRLAIDLGLDIAPWLIVPASYSL